MDDVVSDEELIVTVVTRENENGFDQQVRSKMKVLKFSKDSDREGRFYTIFDFLGSGR